MEQPTGIDFMWRVFWTLAPQLAAADGEPDVDPRRLAAALTAIPRPSGIDVGLSADDPHGFNVQPGAVMDVLEILEDGPADDSFAAALRFCDQAIDAIGRCRLTLCGCPVPPELKQALWTVDGPELEAAVAGASAVLAGLERERPGTIANRATSADRGADQTAAGTVANAERADRHRRLARCTYSDLRSAYRPGARGDAECRRNVRDRLLRDHGVDVSDRTLKRYVDAAE